jgi:acyl-CoA reductase-like NAD-dependent aldehyde dehydrogenase
MLDLFIEKFVEATKKLVVGNPNDPLTNIGALISKPHFEKVHSYVEMARQLGGQIICGGEPAKVSGFEKGYFYLPTVIMG